MRTSLFTVSYITDAILAGWSLERITGGLQAHGFCIDSRAVSAIINDTPFHSHFKHAASERGGQGVRAGAVTESVQSRPDLWGKV